MSTETLLPPETPAEAKSGGGVVLQRPARPWMPSNMAIKVSGLRLCDNEGCLNPATVCFEDGDAVWLTCNDCAPGNVTLTKLRPNEKLSHGPANNQKV
jgi:hypothetical protein